MGNTPSGAVAHEGYEKKKDTHLASYKQRVYFRKTLTLITVYPLSFAFRIIRHSTCLLLFQKILAATYFPETLRSKYLRRWNVSLLSSGWDQVVPFLYSRQA
jgi:hypothetical protein